MGYSRACLCLATVIFCAVAGSFTLAEEAKRTAWGRIESRGAASSGELLATVEVWPAEGQLSLPTPFANVTRAWLATDRQRQELPLQFNPDATKITLHTTVQPAPPATIVLETAEKSGQFSTGRIVFSALDAMVTGKTAKLESHPGNHRIGFWTDADDFVSWDYEATRPGKYLAELTYSAGSSGSEILVSLGESKLAGKLAETGSFYHYKTLVLGKLAIPGPGKQSLAVRCTKKIGAAVMNLKALTLRPVSEGSPIVQADDGSITCHARDVVIHGVKVQWEPKPEKQTVGYWVNQSDTVAWEFAATQPGEYEVEILQGCGKGQGGSEVALSVAGTTLKFIVEDTGHFQNFKPRKIGTVKLDRAGEFELRVEPQSKKAGAIMDLRQVRLLKVGPK